MRNPLRHPLVRLGFVLLIPLVLLTPILLQSYFAAVLSMWVGWAVYFTVVAIAASFFLSDGEEP